MNLLRSFRALAFALVLVSIVGLCLAQKSVGLLLIVGTLAAMSWYVTEGPRGRTLPRWVSNILVIAASLNVFVDLWQNREDVMGVLGRFAVWLTLIKLYERRSARDHGHLLALSLLLVMTACLQTSDLQFGIVLLVYVILGLYVLLLFQLHSSYERSRDERQGSIPAGYRLAPPLRPIIGRHAGRQFRFLALLVGVLGVVLSVIVFVAFPREFGSDMFGSLKSVTADRRSQFAWEVNLIAGGRITESQTRVMSVRLTDSHDRLITYGGPLHLRGAVLDRYDGRGRWFAADVAARDREIQATAGEYVPLVDDAVSFVPDGAFQQHVVLHRAIRGVEPVFSLYAPLGMSVEGLSATLAYEPVRQMIRTTSGTGRLLGYSLRVHEHPDDEVLRRLTMMTRATNPGPGAFRDDSGRVTTLARDLLQSAGVTPDQPRARLNAWEWNNRAAAVFRDYLQSGDFLYTTDLRGLTLSRRDEDPIPQFLFDFKQGHCEYFASALAAMCHSVGIPARLVGGYLASELDDATHEYLVRERNAHVWVEVPVGPHRWAAFDPSPPVAVIHRGGEATTLADRLRNVYSSFESEWAYNIVAYDSSAQGSLVDALSRGWTNRFSTALTAVRDWMARVNQAFYFGPAGYIWMGIVSFALILAVTVLVRLMRRSVAIRRTLRIQHVHGREYQRMLAHLGFYVDMLGVLSRAKLDKPRWVPPLEYANRLASVNPTAADLVQQTTNLFYAARYGRQTLNRQQRELAHALVARLAANLRVKH